MLGYIIVALIGVAIGWVVPQPEWFTNLIDKL